MGSGGGSNSSGLDRGRLPTAQPDFPKNRRLASKETKAPPRGLYFHCVLFSFLSVHPFLSAFLDPAFLTTPPPCTPKEDPGSEASAGAEWGCLVTHQSRGGYKPLALLHGLSRFPLDLICS